MWKNIGFSCVCGAKSLIMRCLEDKQTPCLDRINNLCCLFVPIEIAGSNSSCWHICQNKFGGKNYSVYFSYTRWKSTQIFTWKTDEALQRYKYHTFNFKNRQPKKRNNSEINECFPTLPIIPSYNAKTTHKHLFPNIDKAIRWNHRKKTNEFRHPTLLILASLGLMTRWQAREPWMTQTPPQSRECLVVPTSI